jgi:hypothetical protein
MDNDEERRDPLLAVLNMIFKGIIHIVIGKAGSWGLAYDYRPHVMRIVVGDF